MQTISYHWDDCTLMLEHGSALTHTVQSISVKHKPNTSVAITLKGALIVGTPILAPTNVHLTFIDIC